VLKPIKTAFSKSSLIRSQLAEARLSVEIKSV
jgi:hypothetical protein